MHPTLFRIWHFTAFFTEKTGEFHSNYIPIDLYVGHIDPYFNDLRAVKYIDNKCYYDSWFHRFPQPYLVLKRVNNIWLDHFAVPADEEKMKAIIAEEKEGLFVKKAFHISFFVSVVYSQYVNSGFSSTISKGNSIFSPQTSALIAV